ncbi:hypothetical protein [Arthrobacter sp. NPDC089319]|uniref:hypothetical protein n=1 Tax=Arthrobacter sp. NPDC089319 TaxID=3155915 RepID=UPI003424FC58
MRRPEASGQRRPGAVGLMELEPILVTQEHADRVGILTAVFDVARAHPAIVAARATATTREERELLNRAEARLARLAFERSGIPDSHKL